MCAKVTRLSPHQPLFDSSPTLLREGRSRMSYINIHKANVGQSTILNYKSEEWSKNRQNIDVNLLSLNFIVTNLLRNKISNYF